MTFNFKNSVFFIDYLAAENICLRYKLATGKNINPIRIISTDVSFSVSRTFDVSQSFDFVRFYYLLYFIIPYVKSQVFSRGGSKLLLRLILRGNLLMRLLSKLYALKLSAKANFIVVYYTTDSGVVRIIEPHVVFSASSPYFDYHGSRLTASFSFLYTKNNPLSIYLFNYLFFLYAQS